MTITIKPHATHIPGNVTEPYVLFTATEPHPINITKYVPITSAITYNKIQKKSLITQNFRFLSVYIRNLQTFWMMMTVSGEVQRLESSSIALLV